MEGFHLYKGRIISWMVKLLSKDAFHTVSISFYTLCSVFISCHALRAPLPYPLHPILSSLRRVPRSGRPSAVPDGGEDGRE